MSPEQRSVSPLQPISVLLKPVQLQGDFGAAPQPCQESKFARAKHRYNAAFETAGPQPWIFRSPRSSSRSGNSIRKLCAPFDDAYWLEKDRSGDFPHELHAALAEAGWLGIAMPEEHGGAGLGITEAMLMMQTIAESGAAMSGASAVHMNIFGLQPVIVFGTDEQKRRMLPPLIAGKDKACFAVTEPDAGLDTTALKARAERRGDHYVLSGQKIWISTAQVANKILILARTTPLDQVKRKTEGLSLFYTDLDRSKVDIRVIDKMGRHAVDSNEMFFDAMPIPAADRIGAEGDGFRYDPARHEPGAHPDRRRGGRHRPRRAAARRANMPSERVVFGRPIGQNQGIAHPLAQCWMELEAANLMVMKAAAPLRPQARMWRRGQCRQVSRRRGRLPRLRDRGHDPRRHGLFEGVPRRALSARGHDPAHRTDHPTHDPQLHRREGARPAEVVLGRELIAARLTTT